MLRLDMWKRSKLIENLEDEQQGIQALYYQKKKQHKELKEAFEEGES